MSRSLLEPLPRGKLRADLYPGSVTLARKVSFLRTRLQPLTGVEVEHDDRSLPQSQPWRGSVDALAGLLQRGRKRASSLEVIVSSHFVRYALVPWSENLVRDAERVAFARLTFRDVYGALVDRWEICLDDQRGGQAALACAIDREFLSAIRELAVSGGVRIDGVVPALADCINRHRQELKGRELCLASVETGRVTFAFRGESGWRAVRSRRMDGEVAQALPTLLKQEASAAGVSEGGPLYLCAAHVQDYANVVVPGWKVMPLAQTSAPPPPVMEPALASMES